MNRIRPGLTLSDLEGSLARSKNLAIAANQWIQPANGPARPKFNKSHQSFLIEMAFLKGFLAWEAFLEETFLLYLWGKKSPHRYAPKRQVKPRNRKTAMDLIIPEGWSYVDWDSPKTVRERAERFFEDGEPYKTALNAHINLFQDLHAIRNKVAHRSSLSQQKFEKLVRNETGNLPLGLTVGSFLNSGRRQNPTVTYLDYYLNLIKETAQQIVP